MYLRWPYIFLSIDLFNIFFFRIIEKTTSKDENWKELDRLVGLYFMIKKNEKIQGMEFFKKRWHTYMGP